MSRGIFLHGIGLLMVLGYVATPLFAFGTTNTFGVRTQVGTDTTPPSTPFLRDVVPVSPTQINVVWDAATDNYLLSGYRLFRDGVQIATTTQTSFTDTGLSPTTLYEYTVDAFDSFDNLSSTSLPVATTTLAVPVPPTPTTTPTTTPTPQHTVTSTTLLLLQSFELVPKTSSADIHWQTNINTRYTISWGRTQSYELGTISTNLFKQAHATTLQNLEPGTHYWYSIVVEDTAGNSQILKVGDFATIPAFQSVSPTNVRNISTSVDGDNVILNWVNPVLLPGSTVRVVRNYLFYPQSATDGALVYEGEGTTVTDTGALALKSPQYYSIFVIAADGTVSSGAVTVATKPGIPVPQVVSSTTKPSASSTVTVPDTILDESGDATVLHADSVFVRQGLTVQAFSDGIKLDADIPYTVYIPVDAVAPHLKSILVSIKDPTDQRIITTYLLKLNKAGDAYVADIDPPHMIGVAGMSVEVFDFYQASVRRLTAPITFITPQNPTMLFPDNLVYYWATYGLAVLEGIGIAAFIWLFLLLLRRRREDNN